MAQQSLTPSRSRGLSGRAAGDPFAALQYEMNRLFDDVLGGFGAPPVGGQGAGAVMPRIDVRETGKEIRITAELPGVSERDVEVTVDDDVLTIRGEKRLEREQERENVHVTERAYGTFQRSLRLPFAADPEKVEARFRDGVLTVTLPKTPAQERARHVKVQGAGAQEGGASRGDGSPAGGQAADGGGRAPEQGARTAAGSG